MSLNRIYSGGTANTLIRLFGIVLQAHPPRGGHINARVSLAVVIAPIRPAAHLSMRSRNLSTQHVYLILCPIPCWTKSFGQQMLIGG